MTTCQWAGVGGCKWPGDWFSHRLSKWFCRLHKVMVASADVDDQDPPRCDHGHGRMVEDQELNVDGSRGGALWVCPTCCWSLPRRILEADHA